MKKIILGLFLIIGLICNAQVNPGTNYLSLPTSGSVNVLSNGNTALYICTGVLNMSKNGSVNFSGTPTIGTTFTIWFDSTVITPNSYGFYILGTDVTAAVSGLANQFFHCYYSGTTWIVSNVTQSVNAALVPYASQTYVKDTLSAYPTSATVAANYVEQSYLAGDVFISSLGTTSQAVLDSTGNAATTLFVTRAVHNLAVNTTTPTYVSNAISTAITTATTSITSAYTSAIETAVAPLQNTILLDTLKAGTINLSSNVLTTDNTIIPYIITGNIVLTANVFGGNKSVIEIQLPFSGSYTVTAGANMSFSTITGANTHTSVLTLTWNPYIQTYIQKSFSQN